MHMYRVTRKIGKWYAHKIKKQREKQTTIVKTLRQKANVCPLNMNEEQSMQHAVEVLHQVNQAKLDF